MLSFPPARVVYKSCCASVYRDTILNKFVGLFHGGAADCHMSVIF